MEKCIESASFVLDKALENKPTDAQIPPKMFNKCKAVVLLRLIEAGVGISVTHGNGVIMVQNKEGEWSGPSALGLTGAGLGAMIGGGRKDIIIMIFDEANVEQYVKGHMAYGAESACVAGPIGKDTSIDEYLETGKGNRSFAYTFTEGAIAGFSLAGATVKAKIDANRKFYDSDASPLESGAVTIPEGSAVSGLHEKLDQLKYKKEEDGK